jgi:predicted transglutaminase-like cysteine proteinase
MRPLNDVAREQRLPFFNYGLASPAAIWHNCCARAFKSPSRQQRCFDGRGDMMIAIASFKTWSMKFGTVLLAAFAVSAMGSLPAGAGSERLTHLLVAKVTQPPQGWLEFCARESAECAGSTPAPRNLVLLRREAWIDLVRVNNRVNRTIKPLSDLEHWGVAERWSYPDDGYGDCEDYVLLKRRMLMQSGWPREALLVTVVRNNKGEGHAVLTVVTDKGDYILDNETEQIRLWSESGYKFLKRQSPSNPSEWLSLVGHHPILATASR